MKYRNGFTLIEVMIAVAIVAIIAAVSLPSYRDHVTRGKITEALSTLGDLRVKLEQYYQDNRTYVGACADGTTAPLPTGTKYFTYECRTLTSNTFVIQATGVASQGMGGFFYTVDERNAKATSISADAASLGWTGNTTCWVIRKGGSC